MAIVKNQLVRGSTGDRGLWFNVNDNNNRVAEARVYNSRPDAWTLTVIERDTGTRWPFSFPPTAPAGRKYVAGDENSEEFCDFYALPKNVQLRVNSEGDLRGLDIEP